MIKDFEFFHGVVFSRLFHATETPVTVRLCKGLSNSAYVINENIGLYIKYSASRLTPWQFSFNRAHLNEVLLMKRKLSHMAVALVCGEDGMAVLTFTEFITVLGEIFEGTGWITVTRKRREKYGVKGSAGDLKYKVGDSEGPTKIVFGKR